MAPDVGPELAAAAVSPDHVVTQKDGVSRIVSMEDIDIDKTELACDEDGCVLIPDDGNPHNDIRPPRPDNGEDTHLKRLRTFLDSEDREP